MGTYAFTITCECDGTTLLTVTGKGDQQAWKNDAAAGGHTTHCSACGCIMRGNVSKPRLDSLGGAVSGPIAGGTTVRLNGHAFDVATPVVKFGGIAGTSINVLNDGALDVDTPAGKFKLSLTDGPYQKIAHGSVAGGPFQIGETLTGTTSGTTATVAEVGVDFLLIIAQAGTWVGGETLTGVNSAAATNFLVLTDLPFVVGETLTGASSGASGSVETVVPLTVSGVTTAFADAEEVTGATSGARALLGAPSMSGLADVSVENTNGQRHTGSVLVDAFDYTV